MLNDRINIRVSKWEKNMIETHKLNVSRLFRKALEENVKERTLDYPDKGLYAYAAAWNKISSEVCSILTENDFDMLRRSEERRLDLQRIVAPHLSPKSLERFGFFLQGGQLSDHILVSFFCFNDAGTQKIDKEVTPKHPAKA